jgi:hypothetical protein
MFNNFFGVMLAQTLKPNGHETAQKLENIFYIVS